jgi:hypothetical protein
MGDTAVDSLLHVSERSLAQLVYVAVRYYGADRVMREVRSAGRAAEGPGSEASPSPCDDAFPSPCDDACDADAEDVASRASAGTIADFDED